MNFWEVEELKLDGRKFKRSDDLGCAEIGDYILSSVDNDYFTVGTFYEVCDVEPDYGVVTVVDDEGDYHDVYYYDAEFILFKPAYTEREKSFFRFGRDLDEFHVGDIVQVEKEGVLGVIEDEDVAQGRERIFNVNTGCKETSGWYAAGVLGLVAPVEHTNTRPHK